MDSSAQPILFLTHGAGPMAFVSEADGGLPGVCKGSKTAQFLERLPSTALLASRPKAILVVSAHFEKSRPTVYRAEANDMLFDYGGFPRHTYELDFRPPGAPAVADRVLELLAAAGIDAGVERKRGLDHGAFIPLLLMYPDASIPVLELSVLSSLSPQEHVAMGRALAPLAAEGVLLIGSGSATHGRSNKKQAREFLDWLKGVIADDSLSPAEREERLVEWQRLAPHARLNHPREEHLLPLHVVAAAAGFCQGAVIQDDLIDVMGMALGFGSYAWTPTAQ